MRAHGHTLGASDLVVFTSGSSGTPRAVHRRLNSWQASARPFASVLGLDATDVLWLPGSLAATLSLYAAWHAQTMGTPLLLAGEDPRAATVVHAVPALVERALARRAAGELPRLRLVVTAGDRISAALVARAAAAGIRLVAYYGTAELSFIAICADAGQGADSGEFLGYRPFPGVRLAVAEDGLLWSRSPYEALGYLAGDSGPLRRSDGWSSVGDYARMRPVGRTSRLEILGRGTSAVTVAGHTVLAEEVEDRLRTIPGVEDAVVVGLPDPVTSQRVVALWTGDPRTRLQQLAGELPAPARPRRWLHQAELPRLPGGKVDRIAAAALAQRLADTGPVDSADDGPNGSVQIRSAPSVGSTGSAGSVGSAGSTSSAGSAGSVGSTSLSGSAGSVGSAPSTGSTGSVAGIESGAAGPGRGRGPRAANSPVIVAGYRTPFGTAGHSMAELEVTDLAAPLLRHLVAELPEPVRAAGVGEVVLGNARGPGGNPARLATLAAGLGEHVPAVTVDRQCGSGQEAIHQAAGLIAGGQAQLVLAGGVESASTAPWRVPRTCGAAQMPVDATPQDRAPFAPPGWPDPEMGPAAQALADAVGIDRARQDAYAAASHARTLGHPRELAREIVPVAGVATDDRPRRLSPAVLARLPGAFRDGGSVTAGNSCGVSDGAAVVALVPERVRAAHRLAGLAVLGWQATGCDPALPGWGPVPAVSALLDRLGVALADIAAVEITEAFAAQVLACTDALGLDPLGPDRERVCPWGGAIALGHPWGATGAFLVVRLVHRMLISDDLPDGALGLATCAIGGGQGLAMLVQVVRP